ncbi:D-cysteine desulfhydrase [Serratia sp. M24T3]|uniref:L-cysteate sulfo-lyase n=1 Tax=Rouxiella sp. WC2420 TaxID=3234145 RepID=A0AB39VYW3_9GAMM|nr:D-cysteine desulfhydrase [Serratia sp. M24T3]
MKHQLESFSRIDLVGNSTPLERLNRLSDFVGRDIYIKRDDVTPLALGGNKLRKLEFLAAAAIEEGADTLITAGAIQSNHVRQTAAVAAKLGLKCLALLENPIGTDAENYLNNGNRLLLDLFNTEVVMCDGLYDPMAQMAEQATLLEAQGFRPYIIPVGGSNALGALGYVQCAIEIAEQSSAGFVDFSAVVVASGSAGTHAGLAVAMRELMPTTQLIGVTVSRKADDQRPKVELLSKELMALLEIEGDVPTVNLWDDYFAPRYGEPNKEGLAAIKLLAEMEAMLLDPVYTGKAMAGLLDALERQIIPGDGPILFVHTGGSPALFAYL